MAKRTITVDGVPYRVSIGRTHVKIVPPDGKPIITKIHILLGLSQEQYDKLHWEARQTDYEEADDAIRIRPSKIAVYIQTCIAKGKHGSR